MQVKLFSHEISLIVFDFLMKMINGTSRMEMAIKKAQMEHGISNYKKQFYLFDRILLQDEKLVANKMVFKVCNTVFRV